MVDTPASNENAVTIDIFFTLLIMLISFYLVVTHINTTNSKYKINFKLHLICIYLTLNLQAIANQTKGNQNIAFF